MASSEFPILFGHHGDLTDEERANLALIRRSREVSVAERESLMAPGYVRHRAGLVHLAELFDGSGKVEDDAMPDREFVLLDLTAKGDRVFGIWRVVGTHTGTLAGVPATGRQVDVLEVGVWRCEDGRIAEGWFFVDELGLLRQLGIGLDGRPIS